MKQICLNLNNLSVYYRITFFVVYTPAPSSENDHFNQARFSLSLSKIATVNNIDNREQIGYSNIKFIFPPMIASLIMASSQIFRIPQSFRLLNTSSISFGRLMSTKIAVTPLGHLSKVEKTVAAPNLEAFVSWHPTVDFPYEHSLPVPQKAAAKSTVIKQEAVDTAMAAFKQKNHDEALKELQRITHTHIIVWQPSERRRKKSQKFKTVGSSREGL